MTDSTKRQAAERIVGAILKERTGLELAGLDLSASFLELGFDSLFLIQFSEAIRGACGVKLAIRQLMEDVTSLEELIAFLPEHENFRDPTPASAPSPAPPPAQATPSVAAAVPMRPAGSSAQAVSTDTQGLAAILLEQQRLMDQQLDLLEQLGPEAFSAVTPGEAGTPVQATVPAAQPMPQAAPVAVAPTPKPPGNERFGPYKPIRRPAHHGLTESQERYLTEFVESYNRRTAKSREHAEHHRDWFADPRGVAGYRRIWKGMVYQIAVERSKGARLWDIDDNEYIDIAMGFGLNLFGQSPSFINDALHRQLELGIEVGPQTPLAGEVARMLCKFSRKDRATFCNTGSEAVMTAMRLARTVTHKSKVVFFNKDYHGNFDEVLVRSHAIGGVLRSSPAAPGVPESITDNIIVLDYGAEGTLETIEEYASEIAAVLVEPVQSADPFNQPRDFLVALRQLTEEQDIALIMDEVISGFRAAPGGAQELFDVWGDMSTYGKILGGGLPIGALAGSSRYMDALDGGTWRYDDSSEPEADMTFFAGTFVRHPLAITAAHEVLTRIEKAGPELQRELTERTTYLAESLNRFFEEEVFPIRVAQFSSLFRFMFPPDLEYVDLLYFHLLEKGIFTRGWQENCFLSTAHSDADIEAIVEAVRSSCLQLREAGFLPDAERSMRGEELAPDATTFPLTDPQLEIWVASQMSDEASCTFNEPFVLRFRGDLDRERLKSALERVVARHDAFALRFAPGGKSQTIADGDLLVVGERDLSDLSQQMQTDEVERLSADFGSQPFDLATGPLIRFELVRLGNQETLLIAAGHHIVADGWSWNLLLEEVSRLYVEGLDASLPEAGSFRDYVAESLSAAQREESERSLAYWKEQYREPLEALSLPTDRPRPSVKTYRGGTVRHPIPHDLVEELRRCAAEHKVSVFALTFAAYNLLLSRLSGQHDVAITISTAGQAVSDVDNLVGHCINLLPLRSTFDPEISVSDFLRQVQGLVYDAQEHQACTLGKIVRSVDLPRDPSRMVLTDFNFSQQRDDAGLDFGELEVGYDQTAKRAVTFELFVHLSESEAGIRSFWDYNADLYDPATIERWAGHYETILRAFVADSSTAVEDVPLLDTAQRRQILESWNATRVDYEKSPFHELFERQAMATPEREAVVSGETRLSYELLNERSNQLALHLLDGRACLNETVGIHLERSDWLLVALLGVLKAGGTYLPLDPKFPSDRLDYMADDAGVALVITESSLLDTPVAAGMKTLCIDRDWAALAGDDSENPGVLCDPEDVAYVIYTSGSTGKPKGVEVSHRALSNFLLSMANAPGITSEDTFASLTSISFDPSALELFLPLIVGARVLVVPPEEGLDGSRLELACQTAPPTLIQATPTTWRQLLQSGWSGGPHLKLLCGGEALTSELAEGLLERCGELWNVYGPVEATIWATAGRITQDNLATTPVGAPVANTRIYVLDRKLQPAPIGVQGTLYIGGDCLAHGYLNRPDLTKERFIADPFGAEGERLYNTGDQAKFLADGSLVFLGRLDHQVKIRGSRIELGEIEAALGQHPALRDAVVVAKDRGDDAGDKILVAYLVACNQRPTTETLREHLASFLPDYMLPSAFVYLDEIPLTPNRKIDRKALPDPEFDRENLGTQYEAPTDNLELQLANLWKRYLQVDPVGRHDSFFDLGGDSLNAARMVADVEELTGRRLPLMTLLHAPSVARFAEVLRDNEWEPSWSTLVPIRDHGAKPPLYCVHPAGGNVLIYRNLSNYLDPDQPVYGLQARGLDGSEAPHTRVEDMAAEYVAEIRSFQPSGPYALLGYCLGGTIAYEMAQLLHRQGEEVSFLGLLDTHATWLEDHPSARRIAQQLAFHAGNLAMSGPRGVARFFKQKLDESGRRISRRYSVGKSRMSHRLGRRKSGPMVMLEPINDRAADAYVPRHYPGHVTVFKPRKAYAGYEDPQLGWGNGLVGSLEVVELAVFPAGMLHEPFVPELSREVEARLRKPASG